MNTGIAYSEALIRNGLELQILCKVLEISPAAIVVTDPTGAIEYTNPAFERATGYTAAEAIGQNPRLLKSGSQGPEVYSKLWQTISSGGTWTGRMHNRRKDGSLYWESAVISPLYDDEGNILHYIAVKENVTLEVEAKNHVHKVVKASEVRFRSYFDLPLHGVCITSPEKGWIEVNDRLCAILGYAREELVLKTWAEMTHPDDLAADVEQFERLLSGQIEQYRLEKRFIRKDGAIVWTTISVGCVRKSDGTVDHAVCAMDDITERKRADEALQELNGHLITAITRAEALAVKAEAATRAKSEFLATMSHELRTPMNGVLGFAELLTFTQLDEKQAVYAQKIAESGNHLLAVVDDILDFSSIEKGTMRLNKASAGVTELAERACLPIRKTAADKKLEFHCEVAIGVPDQISCDARRICQILINLLGNAVKFTNQGSVAIHVGTSLFAGRTSLEFSVEDTGIGISSEQLNLLFTPFTQADSTMSRPFQGSGLGLAISKRLAEAMDGTLTVISTPGIGSTFTFHFPLEEVPSNFSAPAEQFPCDPASVSPVAEGGIVLVVEDDRSNRSLIGKMLLSLGYSAEFAAHGAEAVAVFVPGKFFAILMDMQMPVMSGLAATKKIREIESDVRAPIIALTANVMPSDRDDCRAAGMDEFLAKPFKRSELAAALALFAAH